MLFLGGYSSSVVVCHFSGFLVYNCVEFCSIQRGRRASMTGIDSDECYVEVIPTWHNVKVGLEDKDIH